MKKLLLTIAFSLFLILPAQADLGVNIGIWANTAVWHGEGTETENSEKSTRDATGAAGYESFFIEKTLGSRSQP